MARREPRAASKVPTPSIRDDSYALLGDDYTAANNRHSTAQLIYPWTIKQPRHFICAGDSRLRGR